MTFTMNEEQMAALTRAAGIAHSNAAEAIRYAEMAINRARDAQKAADDLDAMLRQIGAGGKP